MAIIGNNGTATYDTSPFDNNSSNNSNSNDTHIRNNGNNGFLIAIEIIFSVLVIFILLGCFLTGIKRKKRIKRHRLAMIENAIIQQEMRAAANHSYATIISCPPPSYSPPDPSTQLPNDAISRLDHLLFQNQCSLPKYSDLYHQGVNRPT